MTTAIGAADLAESGGGLGSEARRLDLVLSHQIDPLTRQRLWSSVDEILARGMTSAASGEPSTGLALGYVQSGKTTAMTALMAGAADQGYQVVIAFLGSTNLLLDQNSRRIHTALGVETRSDYRWISMRNPSGPVGTRDLRDWLAKGRVALLPVLKHAGRIDRLANVVARAVPATAKVLIVDDEADQASMNTRVRDDEESRIYAAIRRLRDALPPHLYVQYTATPYAPLLLEPQDHLLPSFVSFLQPGPGYTGGREFFVDHAPRVIRSIPTLDEQAPKRLPTELPKSLANALANFVVGAATLLEKDVANAPISMLVHSTQRNDVQARYFFLLERLVRAWARTSTNAGSVDELPAEIIAERSRLREAGAGEIGDDRLLDKIRYVLSETKAWLINSTSAVAQIDWNVSPCHILVGGNKLDRGFTVEGLTVTYMNRPTTVQIDTLEQRARAFGYRGDFLPYCQFFATPRTLKVLREVVFTEYDLRAKLQDWLSEGRSVESWAKEVGLMLPAGTRPTRQNVLVALNTFNATSHWHSLRRPSLDADTRSANQQLLKDVGLLAAPPVDYGRLRHPTMHMRVADLVAIVLKQWRFASYSPDWRHDEIVAFLERFDGERMVPVMLLSGDKGPRIRDWDEQTGFVNLFQGADVRPTPGHPFYPGDRKVLQLDSDPSNIVLQVHHLTPRSRRVDDLYTLAIHLGDAANVRRIPSLDQ